MAPSSTWKDKHQTQLYLQSLEPQLHIEKWTDWYSISRSQLERVGAAGMLTAFSRLSNVLTFAYPDIPWRESLFSITRKKSTQR